MNYIQLDILELKKIYLQNRTYVPNTCLSQKRVNSLVVLRVAIVREPLVHIRTIDTKGGDVQASKCTRTPRVVIIIVRRCICTDEIKLRKSREAKMSSRQKTMCLSSTTHAPRVHDKYSYMPMHAEDEEEELYLLYKSRKFEWRYFAGLCKNVGIELGVHIMYLVVAS